MENYLSRYPFGPATTENLAFAAVMNLEIYNAMTFVNLASLTADATLNLNIEKDLPDGAILHLTVPASADGNDLTLGAGIDGLPIVGVNGKTKTQGFVLKNRVFVPLGAAVQIN